MLARASRGAAFRQGGLSPMTRPRSMALHVRRTHSRLIVSAKSGNSSVKAAVQTNTPSAPTFADLNSNPWMVWLVLLQAVGLVGATVTGTLARCALASHTSLA